MEHPDEKDRNEVHFAEYFRRRGWRVERIDSDEQIRPEGYQKPDWFISSGKVQLLCEVKTVLSARRGDDHESDFDRHFRIPLKNHFLMKRFRNLPYDIIVHNSTMTIPDYQKTIRFIKWLEDSSFQINQGRIPQGWERFTSVYGYFYSGEYSLSSITGRRVVQVIVSPHETDRGVRIMVPAYGGINSRSLQSCVRKAKQQLDDEAEYRQDTTLQRIVAIAIQDGIQFDWPDTVRFVRELLHRYTQLSAVALFRWIPEVENFWQISAQWHLAFYVLHNPWLNNTKPLHPEVFDDGVSKQYYNLDELMAKFNSAGL